MAKFEIALPDGRKFEVEAPDQQTAWSALQQQIGGVQQPSSPVEPSITINGQSIPRSQYMAMSDEERQQLRSGIAAQNPAVNVRDVESSILDPYVQGTTFGWADEARGAVQGGLAAMQGGDFGETYEHVVDDARARLATERYHNPVGSFAAEAAGAITTGMGAGGQLVKQGANLGTRALTGGLVGAGQGAVYGAGAAQDDQRAQGALVGGTVGGAVGAAAPYVGNAAQNWMRGRAQNQATNAAIKGAPSADELKSAASAMFQQVDNSGVAVDPNAFAVEVQRMAQKATGSMIDRELDAPAWRVYQIMADRVKAASDAGRGLTLGELHNMRQIAQDVAMNAGKGRTARFANQIVDDLDNVIGNLKPGQLMGGTGADKGKVLLEGIGTWSRARKAGLIEEAIYKAQNQASGVENGLRIQFRQLLQNPNTRRLFNQAEIDAIQRVVRGTTGANITKLIGKFGFGGGNASNMLGGSVGFGFGTTLAAPFLGPLAPIGGALAAGGASLARKGSEVLTGRAANRAAQVMATPNVPVVPPVNPALTSPIENLMRTLGAPSAGQIAR